VVVYQQKGDVALEVSFKSHELIVTRD
jgi:hypothetical protein